MNSRLDVGEKTLTVLHIVSGDRWAGAEVQAFTLLSQLQAQVNLHLAVMNEGELAERCRALGMSVHVFDEERLNSLAILQRLRQLMLQVRPDVIHTHRQKENVLGSLANLASIRVPCVRTVHGSPEFTPSGLGRLQSWLDHLAGRHLQQAVIAVSDELFQQLFDRFPPRKLHLICNGIDLDELNAPLETADFRLAAEQAWHIGLVGRLDPVKRVDLFLEMAAWMKTHRPGQDWHFHVFGEGRLEDSLRDQARQLGLDEQLQFHGHRQDVRQCIASLDVVVMPSDHEGLPMAALETLALGVPLVAHDTGGLHKLLRDSPHCLVKDHHPPAYGETVLQVLEGPRRTPRLGLEYLAASNAEKVLTLYRSL